MAKTGKVKQNPTANPRSRASKRATSPSVDLDRSLRDAPRASDATPVLSARSNGRVTKSKPKQKQLSRGQKKRHEKGLARAEAVQDRLAKKLNDASGKLKKIRERKGMWDEVNGTTKLEQTREVLSAHVDRPEENEWEDEPMQEEEVFRKGQLKVVEGVIVPSTAPVNKLLVVDRTPSAPISDVEDEADKIT
ncbi:hypothetical protein A1O1_09270 [Capronia coronata CBS 617.96]|uniref:Ribosome biogenesis protein Alb1 n=1 Tax=Capronia coronata CBS 617.96 TaxID=1182541 RepID=W9XFA1_9EURO|nr:uncharacterized protein A1O1_09270 [Capronia coronata CBS 617.96]EXJ78868.1 hypothetical protein A1O1_09270 [Capronia coronata CBS 617.96]